MMKTLIMQVWKATCWKHHFRHVNNIAHMQQQQQQQYLHKRYKSLLRLVYAIYTIGFADKNLHEYNSLISNILH